MHITDTEFWNDLIHGILGPRQGGARIIVDAEDAATGVGKTSLAVALAELLAYTFDYELQEEDFTLSGAEYLKRWREHPDKDQPSVIILDELAGAGAGDARRAMATQNVNIGRAWQLMRKKRIVTITTLPHWSDADKKMRRFCDYRLWCLEQPIGYFRAYEVGAGFNDGDERTKGYDDVSRIRFPNMDKIGNDFYRHVSSLKDDLLNSEVYDADDIVDGEEKEEQKDPDTIRREQKIEQAQRMRDQGVTTTAIADYIDMSQSWVSQNTESPDQKAPA